MAQESTWRPLARTRAGEDATPAPSAPSLLMEDRAIATALVAGDEAAFTALVHRETNHVFAICYRVLGDVDEAEEATQEAFVKAYRSLATYRAEGSPGAWLSRIAVREAWRRGKINTRRRMRSVALEDGGTTTVQDTADVQRAVLAEEDRAAVRAALARLNEPYREVITLRYLANQSLAEIATALGRPVGTVKAQNHRGLAQLRVLLAQGER